MFYQDIIVQRYISFMDNEHMIPDEDTILFEKIQQDDINAYEFFFRKYYNNLFQFAYSFIQSKVVSEDIVQEIFLYIWEKRQQIVIQQTLKAYLYASTKNKCLNYIRLDLSKEKIKIVEDESKLSEVLSDLDSIDQNTLLNKYIYAAINSLPKQCKRIFLLSRNAGLTYKEIAEELKLSEKTVENQMGIALKKLRISLDLVYQRYKELV